MPYRADLELANVHLAQVERQIEQQNARIALLQKSGQETQSAAGLLNVLLETKKLLAEYVKRTTPSWVVSLDGARRQFIWH
jgi:hypothetical protein